MFGNYFKIAWRNLWKNKIFSAINIIGLSMGMAVCMMIILFVQYERSFDDMHKKNICRLDEVQSWEGMVQPQEVALSMPPMGPSLKNDFPQVKNDTRIYPFEMAGFASLLIAVFAVSSQTFKAAVINPVKNLRTE